MLLLLKYRVQLVLLMLRVVLLFLFLTILEDSGIIARLSYVLDDLLSKVGLTGKAVYIMLMGLGCNTMSTYATRNMGEKNLKTKTAILNPYISCLARLPVYVLIATAFFSKFAFLVVSSIYLLGFIILLVLAVVLNKIVSNKEKSELILEFPPLRHIDLKHIVQTTFLNLKDFIKRVFGVILCVGVIVWLLTHTQFNFKFTQDITESILYSISSALSFVFAPIGLNNAGIVCSLFVGVFAKEVIISTFAIFNGVNTNAELIKSLTLSSSIISFNTASALSFLIFSAFYMPCISNLAVIKKETDTFTMWFCVLSQFTISYLLSFVVYQSVVHGFIFSIILVLIISLIIFSIIFIIKKVKHNKCLTCGKCLK